MRIVGDVRPGADFLLTAKPTNRATATFVAVVGEEMRVTRRVSDLFDLPNDHPALAHWHRKFRTDGYSMTVGELKASLARRFGES